MTDQPPTITRTPYCHKIRYGITGAPILTADEMTGTFAPGVGVAPTLIELVYSPARDGKPARIAASVTGDWMRFGEPDPFDGQTTTHFKSGPDGWPGWLAEEARLHDPAAETERLREKHKASLRRADKVNNELMEEVQRYAEGKEHPVLWSVYNRMHLRAANAEARVAELERPAVDSDTLPAWLCQRFDPRGPDWEGLTGDDRSYWEHHAQAVRRAVARGGFKAVAPDAASAPPAAPLSPVQPSSVSEAAQSPTGAPTGPRRTLTPNEYSAAWHAVEGAAGEEGADPGTVLHAVLNRLGIEWQDAAQSTA